MISPLLRPQALLLGLLMPVPAAVRAQATPDSAATAVSHLFDRWQGQDSPGCVVGVSRHGDVVFQQAYGMANLETGTANTLSTVFLSASIAKQFTALSVLLLVHDGTLSLEDDIRRFIPELPDYGHRITVRHLLTHTSGLRDFFEMLILARGRFEEDRITQADFLAVVRRQQALNFEPGAEFLYSNTGYVLLALIVERVSGHSLRDFAAERIFTPLGMSHTQFQDGVTSVIPGRAAGYAPKDSGWRHSFANYDVYGSTNLFTTVGDLLIWEANFEQPRVGDGDLIRLMSSRAVLTNGDSVEYGFGLSLVQDRGVRVEEHEGSDPGFHAYLGRYVDQGLVIAILCNTRSANAVALGHSIASIYLDSLLKPEPSYPLILAGLQDSLAGATRAGAYFQPDWVEVAELSWRDGALYTARQGGRRLLPVGRDSFQVEGRPELYVFGRAPRSGFSFGSLIPGQHPARFEWEPPFVAPANGLAGYAGQYFSEELDARYEVTASDSTLLLRTGTSDGIRSRPAFRDTFVAGQLLIRFLRKDGRIVGFQITHPGARRLGFVRRQGGGR